MALLDPVLLKSRLGLLAGRFDVDALDECDSTNSELMRRADSGAPSGTVIVADRQTAGRGRRGRNWLSAPESSLTFSLLWRFSGPLARLSGLSLAVGVGLASGLESLGVQGVWLKWPNDVLLRDGEGYAKLAGILVELSSDRRGTQAIIGIGLNLLPPTGDLPQPAAGLSQVLSAAPERHLALAAILQELHRVLEIFAVDGFFGLKTEWQQRHAWQGDSVQILGEDAAPLIGRCLGADDDGALLLETASGIERIFSGDVSVRPAGSTLGVHPRMIVCLDSGNSRIKWGVHDGRTWLAQGAVAHADVAQLATLPGEWPQVVKVLLANVAGAEATQRIREQLGAWQPIFHEVKAEARRGGVTNHYKNPAQLGVDRWCALLGARAQTSAACVVVMAGTATTIDTLDAQGNFLGGLILPGLDLMHRALARDTAGLPFANGHYSPLPRCTDDAIVSGAIEAQAGTIERAFARLAASDSRCLLSGGNAALLAAHLSIPCQVFENLPLEGLRQLATES